jgi:hypothetical protein
MLLGYVYLVSLDTVSLDIFSILVFLVIVPGLLNAFECMFRIKPSEVKQSRSIRAGRLAIRTAGTGVMGPVRLKMIRGALPRK